jgi:hypothetical protein
MQEFRMCSLFHLNFAGSWVVATGYLNLSLNDIFHGLFRCNKSRPWKFSLQFDDRYDKNKIEIMNLDVRPSPVISPGMHCGATADWGTIVSSA